MLSARSLLAAHPVLGRACFSSFHASDASLASHPPCSCNCPETAAGKYSDSTCNASSSFTGDCRSATQAFSHTALSTMPLSRSAPLCYPTSATSMLQLLCAASRGPKHGVAMSVNSMGHSISGAAQNSYGIRGFSAAAMPAEQAPDLSEVVKAEAERAETVVMHVVDKVMHIAEELAENDATSSSTAGNGPIKIPHDIARAIKEAGQAAKEAVKHAAKHAKHAAEAAVVAQHAAEESGAQHASASHAINVTKVTKEAAEQAKKAIKHAMEKAMHAAAGGEELTAEAVKQTAEAAVEAARRTSQQMKHSVEVTTNPAQNMSASASHSPNFAADGSRHYSSSASIGGSGRSVLRMSSLIAGKRTMAVYAWSDAQQLVGGLRHHTTEVFDSDKSAVMGGVKKVARKTVQAVEEAIDKTQDKVSDALGKVKGRYQPTADNSADMSAFHPEKPFVATINPITGLPVPPGEGPKSFDAKTAAVGGSGHGGPGGTADFPSHATLEKAGLNPDGTKIDSAKDHKKVVERLEKDGVGNAMDTPTS